MKEERLKGIYSARGGICPIGYFTKHFSRESRVLELNWSHSSEVVSVSEWRRVVTACACVNVSLSGVEKIILASMFQLSNW